MAPSHKPVVWGLFAAGGTVAAFLVPAMILITCLAAPLGLLPADALSYDRLLALLGNPFGKLAAFAVLFLVSWHAAHRLRITAHDLGVRNDTLVAMVFYGIAAAATLLLLLSLTAL